MATMTAARTIYLPAALLGDVSARAKEQLDEAARDDFAPRGTIEDAVAVFGRAQRRGLR
jgi:hypothetical protein